MNGGTLTAMTNSHTAHRPGPDPYAYLTALSVPRTGPGKDASAACLGFSIAGQTLARATLICPTPAPAA